MEIVRSPDRALVKHRIIIQEVSDSNLRLNRILVMFFVFPLPQRGWIEKKTTMPYVYIKTQIGFIKWTKEKKTFCVVILPFFV